MSPEEWKEIKGFFDIAADLTGAEQERFLAGIKPEKRTELEKLLRANEDETGRLDDSPIDFSGIGENPLPGSIGGYTILREIGRGGMGSVYEAIRETADFIQKAALKVIRDGLHSEIILRRFRAEQKILASLQHPNIARFLDGGKTPDGMPFYAMEYIEGTTIDEYCRDKRLDEMISLFRQVCAAVSYAHSQLIVHRDLKPSNILVMADGTPKLLDFGIAKILEADDTEPGTATQLGMMTPQFASPEQIRGEKVTTISDVYSLGVIFYTLVTGEQPYKTDGRNYADILEIVTRTEPARPSTVRHTSRALSSLSGDIDNIVLKALQKQPERRYASVEQFSEDLRRFTVGLPVSARADTVGYRIRKFVERNRVAAAATALVFLTLIGGISATTWQAVRAERQRALAEKRFAEVRALANKVVFQYHDEIAKLEGSTAVREMLVTDATTYLDNLSEDAANDPELQRELALAYIRLGDVQGKLYAANMGDTKGAETSYSKAIDLLENAVRQIPGDVSLKDDLITAYDAIVVLMARTGADAAGKKQMIDRSAGVLQNLLATNPNDPKRLAQLSTLYVRYGDSVGYIANKDLLIEKLEHHSKALPLTQKIFELDPNDPANIRDLARIYQRMGTDHIWLGENAELNGDVAEARSSFEKALPYHRKMYETVGQLVRLVPNDPETKRYRSAGLMAYAETLGRNGQQTEALALAYECMKLANNFETSDPNNREAKLGTAFANEIFAKIYGFSGDSNSAVKYTIRALENFEEIFRGDNANFEALNKITEQCRTLAKLHDELGNSEQAALIRKKLEIYLNIKSNAASAKNSG